MIDESSLVSDTSCQRFDILAATSFELKEHLRALLGMVKEDKGMILVDLAICRQYFGCF